jgi:hypothetical protein
MSEYIPVMEKTAKGEWNVKRAPDPLQDKYPIVPERHMKGPTLTFDERIRGDVDSKGFFTKSSEELKEIEQQRRLKEERRIFYEEQRKMDKKLGVKAKEKEAISMDSKTIRQEKQS